MTNGWTDIRNADVVLAMGGNPAENHPVGFRFVMEARRNRNAKLVCVDPRFNRTAAVADRFVQIRAGTDIAFLGGLIHYALSHNRYHEEYVRLFTNAPFIIHERYAFDETAGVFSGWDREQKAYTDKSSWQYELDERGFARVDPTLEHPRSVFQVMKRFYARYTPEMVANISGCTAEDFTRVAEMITSTYTADRVRTIMYALGWTHHSHSVQLIHAAAMLQLLLGNIGRPGGGLNALRGHANIQGGTDCGMAYHNLPGYIPIPKADHQSLDSFLKAVTPAPLRPQSTNFWSNTDRFAVSQLKAFYGTAATRANEFAYDYHPRLPQSAPGGYENWSWAYMFDHMYRGDMEGFFSFGMNPVSNGPHSRKAIAGLSKLKWLVVAENFEQETASFWQRRTSWRSRPEAGRRADRSLSAARRQLRREGRLVRQLGALDSVEVESGRPAGRCEARSGNRRPAVPQGPGSVSRRGRRVPEPMLNLNWWYSNPASPSLDEVAKEINGWAIDDVRDRRRRRRSPRRPAARAIPGYARRRHDAVGQLALRRDVHGSRQPDAAAIVRRPERARTLSGVGVQLAREPPHSLQPLLRGCEGPAVGCLSHRHFLERAALDWRCPRLHRRQPARRGPRRVHHAARGRRAAVRARAVRRRSLVGALRAGGIAGGESAAPGPELQPGREAVHDRVRRPRQRPRTIPIVCTTYRLTEHFHYWTKNNPYSMQLQPEFFVEIPVELAREKAIANGDRVRVTSARGSLEGLAMVTRRIKPMQVAGQDDVPDRVPDSLGLPRPRQAARIAGEPGDADRGRSEFVRAGVQGIPGETGEGVTT